MVAGSFVVFAIACLMAFVFFPIGFILWVISVVMFFAGLGSGKKVHNVYMQQAPMVQPAPNPPFERDGMWFSYVNGSLMVWDAPSNQWLTAPPQSWAPAAENTQNPQQQLPHGR